MTKDEFKQAQSALGQTNQECAEYLGISRRTVDKYRAGELTVPPRIRLMMTLQDQPAKERTPTENKLLLEELAGYVLICSLRDPRLVSIIDELWSYFDALEKDNG